MASANDIVYLKASISKYVPDGLGTGDYLQRVFLDQYGISITTNQKLTAMSAVIQNSFDAFRKSGDFPILGDDPDILTLFTPAGSTQLGRLNEQDPVLSQYAIPGSTSFSIVSLANAVGNISSTFDTGNPSVVPTSLTQVIGNIADIRLAGTEPTTVTSNSLVDKIGKIPINSGMERTSIIEALNYVYTHKTPLLFSFCTAQGDTRLDPPYTTSSPSDQSVLIAQQDYHANMQGLLQLDQIAGSITRLVDDLFTCIKLVAIIAKGKSGAYTVTNSGTPYTSKTDCTTTVASTIIGYVTGTDFNTGITDPDILPIVVGEICAQYDS
ncbi:MAG: hypothetical protein KBC27_01030 [Rickettsiales bacterium]|nr:hypothetical protein [Rickettsiales bacterium]